MVRALRDHFLANDDCEQPTSVDDRNLIERQLDRVVAKTQAIEIHLASSTDRLDGTSVDKTGNPEASDVPQTIISAPWSTAPFAEVKGILHSPSSRRTLSLESRDVLLCAIAKARIWIDDLVEGRVGSFSEIAMREGKVERHIRLLASLAFVSPRIISAIMDGSAPPDLTVTELAQPMAHSWTGQERRIQLRKG